MTGNSKSEDICLEIVILHPEYQMKCQIAFHVMYPGPVYKQVCFSNFISKLVIWKTDSSFLQKTDY